MSYQSSTAALLLDLEDDQSTLPVSILAMEGRYLLLFADVRLPIGGPVSIETQDRLILGHTMALDETILAPPENGRSYIVEVDHCLTLA